MRGPNGNGSIPEASPWLGVLPGPVIDQLQQLVAAQATEMAAMRVYIDQLHQALRAATVESSTPEEVAAYE